MASETLSLSNCISSLVLTPFVFQQTFTLLSPTNLQPFILIFTYRQLHRYKMSDREKSAGAAAREPEDPPKASEHLNIKVTDNNNEVFFKIKRTTALAKLMNAFCERQGKTMASVRFLFDGTRVQAADSPESVSIPRDFQTFRDISRMLLHVCK